MTHRSLSGEELFVLAGNGRRAKLPSNWEYRMLPSANSVRIYRSQNLRADTGHGSRPVKSRGAPH